MNRTAAASVAIATVISLLGGNLPVLGQESPPDNMVDMPNDRGYNYKTKCKKGNCEANGKVREFHVGHIHYVNPVNGKFDPVSWQLQPTIGGWTLTEHSFNPFFPEYADGTASFRDRYKGKDRTIQYTAQNVGHVAAVLEKDPDNPMFDDSPDNLGAHYPDAFGAGLDLWYYNTRSQMVKVASITNPHSQTGDLQFKWKIDLPAGVNFYKHEKATYENGAKLVKKIKTKEKIAMATDSDIDDDELTFLKGARIWDSEGNSIEAEIEIDVVGSDLILTKTVPLSFMQTAVGKVYTDNPTSYYIGAGDGFVEGPAELSWDTAHDAATGAGVGDSGTNAPIGMGKDGNAKHYIYRGFFPVDTSGITDGATISAAVYYAHGESKSNGDNDGTDWIAIIQTTQPSTSGLTTADYDLCGAVDNPTEAHDAGARIDISSATTGGYNSWAFNATGIGWISDSGFTKLGMREGHDITDDPYAGGSSTVHRVTFSTSEFSGTSQDPYLEVTEAAAAGGGVPQPFFPLLFGYQALKNLFIPLVYAR